MPSGQTLTMTSKDEFAIVSLKLPPIMKSIHFIEVGQALFFESDFLKGGRVGFSRIPMQLKDSSDWVVEIYLWRRRWGGC